MVKKNGSEVLDVTKDVQRIKGRMFL